MYGSLFARDLFAELDRLQRDVQQSFDLSPSIRGHRRGGFPALNVGTTPESVELFAFAPGLEPASIEVKLDRGLLTIAGRRAATAPASDATGENNDRDGDHATVHINERFAGAFSRSVSLPDDVDPDAVSASYRDGVLKISVKRRQAVKPRRIAVNA